MKYQHTPALAGKRLLLSTLIFLTLAFLVLGSPEVEGREFHVDDDALPGGNGSEELPFSTIGEAVVAAQEGDVILVATGEYQESVVIDKRLSIIGEDRNKVKVSGDSGSFSVFKTTVDRVSISHMSLNGTQERFSVGIHVEANHTLVRDCAVTANFGGVFCFNVTNYETLLENKTSEMRFLDVNFSGLVVEDSNFLGETSVFVSVDDSLFLNNHITGGGLSVKGDRNIISGNNCSDSIYAGISVSGAGLILKNNRCFNNSGSGISVVESTEVVLENNRCFGNGDHGIWLSESSNNQLINNSDLGNTKEVLDSFITLSRSHNNLLENNSCSDSVSVGIDLFFSDNISVRNCVLSSRFIGIRVYESLKTVVEENVLNSTKTGLHMYHGSTTMILDNQFVNNQMSINHSESSDSTIWENQLGDGQFHMSGDSYSSWRNHKIPDNNSMDGKMLYYFTGLSDLQVPLDAAQVILVDCENVVVENLSFIEQTVGITFISSNNSEIINCSFQSCDNGILLKGSDNNVLTNCQVLGSFSEGIHLYGSSYNTLTSIECRSSGENGIWLERSAHNQLRSNILQKNHGAGIFLESSYSCLLKGNSFLEDELLVLNLSSLYDLNEPQAWSAHDIDTSNTVNGNPLYYISNQDGGTVPEGGGQVILANCRNMVVKGQNCSGVADGITLISCQNMLIQNNTCLDNTGSGILLLFSNNNVIKKNRCHRNGEAGIGLGFSFKNLIAANNCTGNKNGLYLGLSDGGTVMFNTFQENLEGISINTGFVHTIDSLEVLITQNKIQDNTEFGLNVSEGFLEDVVLARSNYWGSASGPYHAEKNPEGQGDRVTKAADFEPWLSVGSEPDWELIKREEERLGTGPQDDVPEEEETTWSPFWSLTGFSLSISLTGLGAGLYLSEPFRFGFLKLFSLYYTRLDKEDIKKDILANTNRGALFKLVKANPGICLSKVHKQAHLGYGTTVYHLTVLLREGFVKAANNGKQRLFWTKEAYPGALSASLTPNQRTVLELLFQKGELARPKLVELSALPRSSLHLTVNQLRDKGLLLEELKEGKYFCSLPGK